MSDVPAHWSALEESLWEDLLAANPRLEGDIKAELLYHAAYFETGITGAEKDDLKDLLSEYIINEYRFEWDDVFDWEEWRGWYDSV